jgi:hypothetical protein
MHQSVVILRQGEEKKEGASKAGRKVTGDCVVAAHLCQSRVPNSPNESEIAFFTSVLDLFECLNHLARSIRTTGKDANLQQSNLAPKIKLCE